MTKFTTAQLEQAIRSQGGNLAAAAKALAAATGIAIARQSVSERVRRSARLRQAVHEASEEVIDVAENAVVRSILSGDLHAAMFVLKTQGRGRGWTRRDPVVKATTDPTKLSDEELDAALSALEAEARAQGLTIDLEPVVPPRALPSPRIKRPRD